MSRIEKSKSQIADNYNRLYILHVDDDESLQRVSKLILQSLNCSFQVDQACCVDDAFKKLSTRRYHAIISDFQMPNKDGLDFLKQLCEEENELPFILFTGKGKEEIAEKAQKLGILRDFKCFAKCGNPETVYSELVIEIIASVKQAEAKNAENQLQNCRSKTR
jgi:DNA-binding NtrC family response regulator